MPQFEIVSDFKMTGDQLITPSNTRFDIPPFDLSIMGLKPCYMEQREFDACILTLYTKLLGGVSEWFKETVLKTVLAFGERGFESHPLRHLLLGDPIPFIPFPLIRGRGIFYKEGLAPLLNFPAKSLESQREAKPLLHN